MDSNWFEDEAYEDEDDAKDMLRNLIKESERSCKRLLKYLDTAPQERKYKEVIKEPKKASKPTKPKKKPDEKPSIGYIKIPIPSTDIKIEINRRELGIFLLGMFLGALIVLGVFLGYNLISS